MYAHFRELYLVFIEFYGKHLKQLGLNPEVALVGTAGRTFRQRYAVVELWDPK